VTATATTLGVWLDAVLGRSRALLLEGPPGIGKSHLLRDLLESAGPHHRVLRAQPAEAETRLIGSALIDLCADIDDDEVASLPEMQAAALSAALLREQERRDPNPHAVALAFTTLVRRLAEQRPLLICIDDIQWLDAQTARVIAFVARRLPEAGVGLALTLRTEPGVPSPELVPDLEAALPLARLPVPPMPSTDLAQVIRARLGASAPGPLVRAAVTAAGGNPLFGIEIARTMAGAAHDPADAVPLPESLAELIGRHVLALPETTRTCLAAAAALRRPSVRDLRELGLADNLDDAERAGLVLVEGHDVTFTHPLYAAAAYDGLVTGERRRLHTRLAGVVTGAEERARHLALGADEPDETVAEALDGARESALRRGAPDAALDAGRLAVQATPIDSPKLAERRTRFGHLIFRAGETERAKAELAAAVECATEPLDRARALHVLARVRNDTEGSQLALPDELAALELAGDDLDLLADIHMGLATSNSDDWVVALDHARIACELLEQVEPTDPIRLAEALTALLGPLFYSGGGADLAICARAIELQGKDMSLPVSDRAMSVLFYLLLWTDAAAAAREQMDVVLRQCLEEGDEPSRCYVLSCRAPLEVRAGNWDEADRLIDECVELSQTSQNPHLGAMMTNQRAVLGALRGDLDEGIRTASADIERGVAIGNGLLEQRGRGLRGFCRLVGGDVAGAVSDFDRYEVLFESMNAAEPALWLYAADRVEALIAAGRLDDAEQALAAMVEPAARLGRTAVLAASARVEALLRAEQGDPDAALAAADHSVGLYDTIERRFDRARAVLTKGELHRRFKQKSLARQELTAARDAFDALGAATFAARAAAELGRVGLRPPPGTDLTGTEREIAILAADGVTSAEIGRRLSLSTKTVSANLTRIYRKLGVRQRSELASVLSRSPSQ
jgi:DNA-binding CsgD family transcriptional regulator